ncbi:hypothetical protein G0U57_012465, partial [Chelydra serpentina]
VLAASPSPSQRPDTTLVYPDQSEAPGPESVSGQSRLVSSTERGREGGRRTRGGDVCVSPCACPSACTPGMGAPVTPACLLLLLHLTAGTSAEPHYVVVIPAELYHPHTGTVSVHLSDLNETVRVSVRLERGDGPSALTLLEREVQEPRLHENVRFQVPAPSGGSRKWRSCTSRSGEMPCSSLSGRKCCCGRWSPAPLCRRTRPSTSRDRQVRGQELLEGVSWGPRPLGRTPGIWGQAGGLVRDSGLSLLGPCLHPARGEKRPKP